jgi:uncharacterized protein YgbK (DUF1537 family)
MAGLTILADDLSGAADCGVQAARRGMRTVVRLGPPTAAGGGSPGAQDALAWDLDTRSRDAATAFERTRAAAKRTSPDGWLYIKVDSALRGHIGAALDAAVEAPGARLALVAPAFPAQGRTTIDGLHRIRGGVCERLSDLLSTQSRHAVATLRLDAIRAGDAVVTLGGLDGPGPWIIACDAEDEADLERLAREVGGAFPDAVWAGSAGLAGALAEVVAGSARRTSPARLPIVDGSVLVVAGSTAQETRTQVESLLEADDVGVVAVPAEALVAGGQRGAAEAERAAAALASLLAAGGDAVLRVVGRAPDTAGPRIAAGLGAIVAAATELAPPAGLVLTGGETARAVCDALGVDRLELLGEVEPGISMAIAVAGGAGSSRPVVTKAGAFGGPESLVRARDVLHGRIMCPTP